MKFVRLLAVFISLHSMVAHAVLEVTVLKQDEEAFPIVIAPFEVVGDTKKGQEIADIMRDNFNRSGEFNASSSKDVIYDKIDYDKWRSQKVEALVYGRIEKVNQKVFKVKVYLLDIYSSKELYTKEFSVHNSGIRRIAHYLSDQIYEALLGEKGSFYTRLSYVTVVNKGRGNREYRLEISHSDAQNPQTILISSSPIL